MAGQRLCASAVGIERIRTAMKRNGWTQREVADEAGFSRATLNKILGGQNVRAENLEALCDLFELEVGQIAEVQAQDSTLDKRVQELREQVAPEIQKRCGEMRILDMTQPIDSTAIYTDVNILEKVTSKTRGKLEELRQGMGPDDFDRFCLGQVKQERVPGIEALRRHRLLMILGKPGAGKTTFLKRLAMGCRAGQWGLGDRVPFFVSLKEFADDEGRAGSLLQFIEAGYELTGQTSGVSSASLESVLRAGRSLVLLDGLDEVQEAEHDRVLREIREFAHRYDQNQIVSTCRIAAKEYIFERFTEIEVADFNDEQIQDFANKWFKAREPEQVDEEGRSAIAREFWQALQENEPVRELANNPLLLTLLVLEFGDSFEFPSSRSELYEQGLNVLLSKWDGSRYIRREEIYKKLPIKRKKRLLAQLAWATFEKGDYFFKQRVAEAQIQQYIQNLPGAETDDEALLVDSGLVLRAIEAQHGLLTQRAAGIYSFSHLTFHEYFVSSQIAGSSELQKAFPRKIFESRWREVFLVVSEQLTDASNFLLAVKQEIDSWVSQDARIQEFLQWQLTKQESVESPYKPSAVRAFYGWTAIDLARARTLALARARARASALAIDLASAIDDPLLKQLKSLQQQLKNASSDGRELSIQWWNKDGARWSEELRQTLITHRNIGHDWQFTKEQSELLGQYYTANLLLIQCLNTECEVSREVRQEIEDTLLLPYDKIQKYNAAKAQSK